MVGMFDSVSAAVKEAGAVTRAELGEKVSSAIATLAEMGKVLVEGDKIVWVAVDDPALVALLRESPTLR